VKAIAGGGVYPRKLKVNAKSAFVNVSLLEWIQLQLNRGKAWTVWI